MKLEIELLNKKTEKRISKELQFEIETSFSPQNIWLVTNIGGEKIKDDVLQTYVYKKVICIHYGTVNIEAKKMNCKVASIADSNSCELIADIIMSIDGFNDYDLIQEYSFDNRRNTYLIDLEEIKTIKEFEGLSTLEIFSTIIRDYPDSDKFHYLFYRYIVNGDINNTISDNQYQDMIE